MILSLRQAIVQRVQGKSAEELTEVINDSIGGDDKALPGLGVLFELIWENSEPDARNSMVAALGSQLEQQAEQGNPTK